MSLPFVKAEPPKSYVETELDILVKTAEPNNRPVIEEFIPEIIALVHKFNKSGQSGGSAPFVAAALSNAVRHLCLNQPICDITGIPEEWNNTGNSFYQNKRCSSLFKEGKYGRPYYLDAIVWRGEDDYDTFTGIVEGINSRQFVQGFPFKPKTFYICS